MIQVLSCQQWILNVSNALHKSATVMSSVTLALLCGRQMLSEFVRHCCLCGTFDKKLSYRRGTA